MRRDNLPPEPYSALVRRGPHRALYGDERWRFATNHQPITGSDCSGARKCQQVAAVCYRIRGSGIEFLLVQTRGGRWTFPKGGVEPGLTHAQAAALEAYEEAGVHGRMEEVSFTRYVRRKGSGSSSAIEVGVSAHLCEVLRLGPPQEFNRNRTWFSAEKAKRRLREERSRTGSRRGPGCGTCPTITLGRWHSDRCHAESAVHRWHLANDEPRQSSRPSLENFAVSAGFERDQTVSFPDSRCTSSLKTLPRCS